MDDPKTPEHERMESENADSNSSHQSGRAVLPLTERQLRVLVAIEQFVHSRGYPPTVRALCEMLGLTSTSGVVDHLEALVRKGYIERDATVTRGMRVLVASVAAGPILEPRLAKSHPCTKCGRRSA